MSLPPSSGWPPARSTRPLTCTVFGLAGSLVREQPSTAINETRIAKPILDMGAVPKQLGLPGRTGSPEMVIRIRLSFDECGFWGRANRTRRHKAANDENQRFLTHEIDVAVHKQEVGSARME